MNGMWQPTEFYGETLEQCGFR